MSNFFLPNFSIPLFSIPENNEVFSSDIYFNLMYIYTKSIRKIHRNNDYIDSALQIIYSLSNPDIKTELLKPFIQNLEISKKQNINNILPAIKSLNDYITRRFYNLNEYLLNNEIMVSEEWATYSKNVGYEINIENINYFL